MTTVYLFLVNSKFDMYTPKFNDKRVKRKMRSALGMTLGCLSADKPRPLGSRFIDKHYGQAQLPLSQWLRKQLLICTDENYSMGKGKTKQYIVNTEGVEFVKQILANNYVAPQQTLEPVLDNHKLAVEWAKETYDLNEPYEDKSQRLFHPVQFMRKQTRNVFLSEHGMTYQYDIRTAAPNLLHQRSWVHSHGHVLETIDHYIENKSQVRKKLALEAELPEENIKVLINSLFAGAALGASHRFSCWNYCNQDKSIIEFLKQHPYIIALRADIKQMWEYLKADLVPYHVVTSTGKTRRMQMTPRNKWHLYFSLERQVLNEIRNYLNECNLEYFLIHDAFVSSDLPNGISDLEMYIESKTGFRLNFDQEQLLSTLHPSV